ncbi:MAG: DUF6617 family protein [Bacteroidota bacterium]
MESKILHSIMHGELMPWAIDLKSKTYAEKIRALGNKEPDNMDDLTRQVKALVNDLPDLSSWFNKNIQASSVKIIDLYFSCELPPYHDTITKYYDLLISKEVLRVFNVYLLRSSQWSNNIDIIYHTTSLLRNLKTLTKQVNTELNARNCNEFPNDQSNPIHYSLYLLKLELILLYFSIQEVHKNVLEEVFTLEDFYLLELNEPISSIKKIYPAKEKEFFEDDNKPKIEHKINFGFKGKPESLKTIITQLTNKVYLLNEAKTSTDDLLSVLTSKNLIPGSAEIHLDCETAVFRDIYDQLKLLFTNLTLTAIEKSKVFYSKNGTLLKAQNLSSSKIENSKSKEEINKIFN